MVLPDLFGFNEYYVNGLSTVAATMSTSVDVVLFLGGSRKQ